MTKTNVTSQIKNHEPVTISELIDCYKRGDFTASDYLNQKLTQVQNDAHNAWISVLSQSQLEGYIAHLNDRDIEDLPLYGVPFAIKDNIDLVDLPTTAGCREFSYQPDSSAFVVQTLINAGAIPLGKTNLDQFATGLVGTRSPFGETLNSFDPKFISGGSSSGSAVAVATDQVLFSLGTDTAGSGRVPAAFNNVYGVKPTKGLLSCQGVVPACRSLDCVTLFSKTAQDLKLLLNVAAKHDPKDCFSKINTPLPVKSDSFLGVRVGVPSREQLAFFGNDDYQAVFEQTVADLEALGAEIIAFDLAPFIDAAKLLYQGPWVAERYAAIEDFFKSHSGDCLPVIEHIIGGAEGLSAVETFKAMYQLQAYKVKCDAMLGNVDVVLTPTAGTTYTIEQVNADPVALNSQLGYYTNFMNLLDYSAIAIPAGFTQKRMPFGVTLFAPAFSDDRLLSLAQVWQSEARLPLGATERRFPAVEEMELMVCGAHMQDLPLNHQLIELGGRLLSCTHTAEHYRLYQLAGGPPMRPGLFREGAGGQSIEVEVWSLPVDSLGSLLLKIPHPLGLGSVELSDGRWVKGFICEPSGQEGATDITHFGGWRNFIAQSN